VSVRTGKNACLFLIPCNARIQAQHLIRLHPTVHPRIRPRVSARRLHLVERSDHLRLDEVDEDEVDERVGPANDRCARGDKVRNTVRWERRVRRVVADAGAGLSVRVSAEWEKKRMKQPTSAVTYPTVLGSSATAFECS
jgi:hypothetical protein